MEQRRGSRKYNTCSDGDGDIESGDGEDEAAKIYKYGIGNDYAPMIDF